MLVYFSVMGYLSVLKATSFTFMLQFPNFLDKIFFPVFEQSGIFPLLFHNLNVRCQVTAVISSRNAMSTPLSWTFLSFLLAS